MHFFYNKIKSWHSVFQLGRFAMTNAEYMEYEGYGLIEAALYSYTATADGSDLFSLAESRPAPGLRKGSSGTTFFSAFTWQRNTFSVSPAVSAA